MLFEPSTKFEDAVCFSRFDGQNLLSTVSAHPFTLDEREWLSAEHYYQANKFDPGRDFEAICAATTAEAAHKLGNRWFRPKRKQFKTLRPVLMTRALYTKACAHAEVREWLLSTDDLLIAETSQYGHYWGIGRDQRGQNQLGKIWMDIRRKLRESAAGGEGE